jgi:hypothetical protein
LALAQAQMSVHRLKQRSSNTSPVTTDRPVVPIDLANSSSRK